MGVKGGVQEHGLGGGANPLWFPDEATFVAMRRGSKKLRPFDMRAWLYKMTLPRKLVPKGFSLVGLQKFYATRQAERPQSILLACGKKRSLATSILIA